MNGPPQPGSTAARTCQTPPLTSSDAAESSECVVVLVEVKDGPTGLIRARREWREEPGSCSGEAVHCEPHLDAGRDPQGALLITGRPGQLAFAPSPQVELVEIRRADVDGRGVLPDSCLGVRDQVMRLLAAGGSCVNDDDCTVRTFPASVPASERGCLYTDVTTARALGPLDARWSQECESEGQGLICPASLQVVCHAGRCATACYAGRICPSICDLSVIDVYSRNHCASKNELCRRPDDSRWCRCNGSYWACANPNDLLGCSVTCDLSAPQDAATGADAADAGSVDGVVSEAGAPPTDAAAAND
jgi:hypothetical protein